MNLESALTPDMIAFALRVRPHDVCLVPERRAELTTEGGLDVARQLRARRRRPAASSQAAGIRVSLFIDAGARADRRGARGRRAGDRAAHRALRRCRAPRRASDELGKLGAAAAYAAGQGLHVNAGHGLNYENVQPIARLPGVRELNIGHAIVARAVFVGLAQAVREMKALIGAGAMIYGIGIDVVEPHRIARLLEKYGERFARRVLTALEWPGYEKTVKPVLFLANRFAAKEAFSKAMGTGFRYP